MTWQSFLTNRASRMSPFSSSLFPPFYLLIFGVPSNNEDLPPQLHIYLPLIQVSRPLSSIIPKYLYSTPTAICFLKCGRNRSKSNLIFLMLKLSQDRITMIIIRVPLWIRRISHLTHSEKNFNCVVIGDMKVQNCQLLHHRLMIPVKD